MHAIVLNTPEFSRHDVKLLRIARLGPEKESQVIAIDYTDGVGWRLRFDAELTRLLHREKLSGLPQPSSMELHDAQQIILADEVHAAMIDAGATIAGGFLAMDCETSAPVKKGTANVTARRLLRFYLNSPAEDKILRHVIVNLTARRIDSSTETAPCGSGGGRSACPAPHHIEWPADNPIWSLCWVAPDQSSGEAGSGLEITDVYYQGRKVLKRAHVPCLNVKYDSPTGGCGPYRDWLWELATFDADNELLPGYAEPTRRPTTTCDNPGNDVGQFKGVAAEKQQDLLVLTTQCKAGWYRYGQKWVFHRDGTIDVRFLFSHVSSTCIYHARSHHAYYRFDFDIDGSENDVVEEQSSSGQWSQVPEVAKRRHQQHWRVRQKNTNVGYEVIPGADDEQDADPTYSIADMWALLFRESEVDDGGQTSGDTRARMNSYVNGESIDSADVVIWYRAGARALGGLGCEVRGPTLKPFGW